jgi:hypothetical protein
VAIETIYPHATAATGENLLTPPYADPADFADVARLTAIVPGGCHLWLGELFGNNGYGRVTVTVEAPDLYGPRLRLETMPHRYAWSAWHGTIPDGGHVLHQCDEPLCAPLTARAVDGHLHTGNPLDNALECARRGRQGSTRHGLRQYGADTRPRLDRARQLQAAVRSALRAGRPLADAVAEHREAGSPRRGQLVLPLRIPQQRHLRLVG